MGWDNGCPDWVKQKISNTLKRKGIKPPSRKGTKLSKEVIDKILKTKKERNSMKHTPETTAKIQAKRKIFYDNVGRTSHMRDLLESTDRYHKWRLAVLFRDQYQCVKCQSKDNIQVHHKIPLDHFIRLANNSIEQLFQFSNLFDINNGETLCFVCHKITDTFGKQNTYGLDEALKIKGTVYLKLQNVFTGKIIEDSYTNMFVTAGKNSLAQSFQDSTKGMITYHANGTSTQAPALSDTSLIAELFRKLISVRSYSSNVFTAQTFFTTSESNGTIREMGLFGDSASDTTNSGTLFCRAAVNRTKSSSDTLTASWSITIG